MIRYLDRTASGTRTLTVPVGRLADVTVEHPERTSTRSAGWDVELREWPSAGAMLTAYRMGQSPAPAAPLSEEWTMTTYRAALFAPDGDYVTDYAAPTVTEVWDRVDNGGSRWYFYPFPVIVTDRPHGAIRATQRIVDAPEALSIVKGRTLRTFARMLAALSDADRLALHDGIPLDWMVTA